METIKHKCKLCSRRFSSGRALGGHMRSHLATLPIPPPSHHHHPSLSSSSSSSSSSSEDDHHDDDQRSEPDHDKSQLVYALRENPKRSFRFADPEFSFAAAAASLVQDRESDTDSRNPTRRRSKRPWKLGLPLPHFKKPNFGKSEPPDQGPEPEPEPEPVSSVSDTWPEEEGIALCLVMLSRDRWTRSDEDPQAIQYEEEERSVDETCKKLSPSSSFRVEKQVSVSKPAKKKIKPSYFEDDSVTENGGNVKIFECPFCSRVFTSGQALGGHKRSHLLNNSTTTAAAAAANSEKFQNGVIDLNLPAPPEDYAFSQHSAVSYAEFMGGQ